MTWLSIGIRADGTGVHIAKVTAAYIRGAVRTV